MNTKRDLAQIYQFPAGGRALLGGGPHLSATKPIEPDAPRGDEALCSGSWYHQEAIDEAKPAWER